jgi:hypothetical protein
MYDHLAYLLEKVTGEAVPVHAIRECRRSRGINQLVLTMELGGDEWSVPGTGRFTPGGKIAGIH